LVSLSSFALLIALASVGCSSGVNEPIGKGEQVAADPSSVIHPEDKDPAYASKKAKVLADEDTIATAAQNFKTDCGRYPTIVEGINALRAAPPALSAWKGPYLKSPVADPWGFDYILEPNQDGSAIQILCYGADGKPGGVGIDADIIKGL
jgi:type II secretion system protein G